MKPRNAAYVARRSIARKKIRDANPEIHRARNALWKKNNPEKVRGYSAAARARDPEKHREHVRKSNARHRPKRAAGARKYVSANLDKFAAWAAKRRADQLRATPPWADHDKIDAVYAEAARLTRQTGVRHVVDHFYPLRGRDGSRGLHVDYNLRVIPESENARKNNRPPNYGSELASTNATFASSANS